MCPTPDTGEEMVKTEGPEEGRLQWGRARDASAPGFLHVSHEPRSSGDYGADTVRPEEPSSKVAALRVLLDSARPTSSPGILPTHSLAPSHPRPQ